MIQHVASKDTLRNLVAKTGLTLSIFRSSSATLLNLSQENARLSCEDFNEFCARSIQSLRTLIYDGCLMYLTVI